MSTASTMHDTELKSRPAIPTGQYKNVSITNSVADNIRSYNARPQWMKEDAWKAANGQRGCWNSKEIQHKIIENKIVRGLYQMSPRHVEDSGQRGFLCRLNGMWQRNLFRKLQDSHRQEPDRVSLTLRAVIGLGIFAEPKGSCWNERLGVLMVGDGPTGKTHLFDIDGSPQGTLPLKLGRTISFLAMDQATFLACDGGRNELVRFDARGRALESIVLADALPHGTETTRPIMAVPHGQGIAVLLTDASFLKRAVALLEHSHMQLLPSLTEGIASSIPGDICGSIMDVNGSLHLAMMHSELLWRYTPKSETYKPVVTFPILPTINRCTFSDGMLFYSGDIGKRIFVADAQGRRLCVTDRFEDIPFNSLGMFDLHAFQHNGGRFLSATDRDNKCVYLFSVKRIHE